MILIHFLSVLDNIVPNNIMSGPDIMKLMVFVVARLFFKHAVEMTVSLKHVYHLLPT
jgi:hypothetical protein